MSNYYSLYQETFHYRDGTVIAASVRIDRDKLSRFVWRAAKNKNGKKIAGALKIEAKRLSGPTGD